MAANALGTIGTEVMIDPLVAVLANDPDWFARLGAAEGLQQALKDEDARMRAAAAAGLP